jgi:3-methyladenine DNA glycosylase Mpg
MFGVHEGHYSSYYSVEYECQNYQYVQCAYLSHRCINLITSSVGIPDRKLIKLIGDMISGLRICIPVGVNTIRLGRISRDSIATRFTHGGIKVLETFEDRVVLLATDLVGRKFILGLAGEITRTTTPTTSR